MILLFEQDLEHNYLSIEIVAQFRLIALHWRIQCNFVPKNLVRFTNSEKNASSCFGIRLKWGEYKQKTQYMYHYNG